MEDVEEKVGMVALEAMVGMVSLEPTLPDRDMQQTGDQAEMGVMEEMVVKGETEETPET
jgi:hypothetical protein